MNYYLQIQSPIAFATNDLLPLRFVNHSSLNLFNKSIKNPQKKRKLNNSAETPFPKPQPL